MNITREEISKEYNELLEKPRIIFEIFKDYFGESKVDFQGFVSEEAFIEKCLSEDKIDENYILDNCTYLFIIVWFPKVRVTNEKEKFIDIYDLYAKVCIDYDGLLVGKFYLNGASFTREQLASDYMHSHCPGIPRVDFDFRYVCTGYGPINMTIGNLNSDFDEDLWQLFCSELDDFTKVESLSGGPYRHLEEVHKEHPIEIVPNYRFNSTRRFGENSNYNKLLKDFFRDFLKNNDIPIEYSDKTYSVGMSFVDLSLLLSNHFISWFNKEDNPYRKLFSLSNLKSNKILNEYSIINGRLCKFNSNASTSSILNRKVCFFKGNLIMAKLISAGTTCNSKLILDISIISGFVSSLCRTLNFKYGKGKEKAIVDRQTYYI